MTTLATLGEQMRRGREQRPATGGPIRACGSIQTASGPVKVIASWRGDRWLVRAACGAHEGNGVGPNLSVAMTAALKLIGVDAAEIDR
jgi:hypothetical protein